MVLSTMMSFSVALKYRLLSLYYYLIKAASTSTRPTHVVHRTVRPTSINAFVWPAAAPLRKRQLLYPPYLLIFLASERVNTKQFWNLHHREFDHRRDVHYM